MVPHLTTALTGPLLDIETRMLENEAAIERWRGSTMSTKRLGDDPPVIEPVEAPAPAPAAERGRLLRKPAEAQAAVRQEFANPFVRRPQN